MDRSSRHFGLCHHIFNPRLLLYSVSRISRHDINDIVSSVLHGGISGTGGTWRQAPQMGDVSPGRTNTQTLLFTQKLHKRRVHHCWKLPYRNTCYNSLRRMLFVTLQNVTLYTFGYFLHKLKNTQAKCKYINYTIVKVTEVPEIHSALVPSTGK